MHRFLRRLVYVVCSTLLATHFAYSAVPAYAAEEKVILGNYVLYGLASNQDGDKPEWFKQFSRNNDDLDNKRPVSLEVTKEQAAEVTTLFSDDLTPLMYTPEEFSLVIGDMRGLDSLSSLQRIGVGEISPEGMWWQPFSKEQLGALYFPTVKYFAEKDVASIWPNLDITTVAKNPGGFPVDETYKKTVIGEATDKIEQLKGTVEGTNLPEDRKNALRKHLEDQLAEYKKYINSTDTGFYYYIKKFEPTMDEGYAESSLAIKKEEAKYSLEQSANEQLKELNKDPEKNSAAIEHLKETLKEALSAVDTIKDPSNLKGTEDDGIVKISTIYPTSVVEEAELLVGLSNESVSKADANHDDKISAEEKLSVDQKITNAKATLSHAVEVLSKLPKTFPASVKEKLEERIKALNIPDSVEVTPDHSAEINAAKEAVEKAEGDPTAQNIAAAKEKVGALPPEVEESADLKSRVDDLDRYTEAKSAVEKAKAADKENKYAAIAEAEEKISKITHSNNAAKKDALTAQLDKIKKLEDAERAVEAAEAAGSEQVAEKISAAKTAVEALPADSPEKEKLSNRIDALEKVVAAETDPNEQTINTAETAVNNLPEDAPAKKNLQKRVDALNTEKPVKLTLPRTGGSAVDPVAEDSPVTGVALLLGTAITLGLFCSKRRQKQ